MLRINNEKELLNILRIVSEESVKKSRSQLKESRDVAQERYVSNLSKNEKMYGVSLTEQEDESGESAKEKPDEEVVDGDEEKNKEEELSDPEAFGYSFDSVLKDINTLRAGRSTKDKEIKEELLEYYDRLDEDERKILHLFLSELSKILQGAIDGSEALDPSDAPLYADIILGKEEPESEKESKPSSTTQVSAGGSAPENSAPPIKVNESQDLREVRATFRKILKRL